MKIQFCQVKLLTVAMYDYVVTVRQDLINNSLILFRGAGSDIQSYRNIVSKYRSIENLRIKPTSTFSGQCVLCSGRSSGLSDEAGIIREQNCVAVECMSDYVKCQDLINKLEPRGRAKDNSSVQFDY